MLLIGDESRHVAALFLRHSTCLDWRDEFLRLAAFEDHAFPQLGDFEDRFHAGRVDGRGERRVDDDHGRRMVGPVCVYGAKFWGTVVTASQVHDQVRLLKASFEESKSTSQILFGMSATKWLRPSKTTCA